MPIRGQYHTQVQNISVDLPAHLFENDRGVVSHEATHFWLSCYTNQGSVYSILTENSLPPIKWLVDKRKIDHAMHLLHQDMYLPQEGLAHLMQANQLYEEDNLQAVKDWEDSLPDKPKDAYSYVRDTIKFSMDRKNTIVGKLADIAMNNGIHIKVISDPNFLITDSIEIFLKDKLNSAAERYKTISYAIQRDPSLLDLTNEEICEKVGLQYHPLISNAEKALLINAITSLTDFPQSAKESDIKSLTVDEAIMSGLQSIILIDANLVSDARVGVSEAEILFERKYFRTMFIYNNPESQKGFNRFGFYSFSRRRNIINGIFKVNEVTLKILKQRGITKVFDSASFDFETCKIKPERDFITPDIIWYKSAKDFQVFIEMAEKMNLTIEKCSFSFTENHPYRFILLKIKGQNILHIAVGYNSIENQLIDSTFPKITVDVLKMIKGKEKDFNNFFHDILGIPYPFDMFEMFKDPEGHLQKASEQQKHEPTGGSLCICGSGKKYKNCHQR